MDPSLAIQQTIQERKAANQTRCGFNESRRKIENSEAVLCFLASNCDNQNYVKTIEALCRDRSTPIIKIESNELLGKWAGLCKLDEEGEVKKMVKCSCLVLTKWGRESEAQTVVRALLGQGTAGEEMTD